MSLGEGFLQDIIDHPEDDSLRLIYADWLQEQGDEVGTARAEFIRIQCERARLSSDDPRSDALYTKQNRLLLRFEKAWLGELHSILNGWAFRRGFVISAQIGVKKLLEHANALFCREPVREMSIRGGRHQMRDVASSPHLARLSVLRFNHSHLDDVAVGFLAASSYLTGLTHLSLAYNRIGDLGVQALLASPYLKGLKKLKLHGNPVSDAVQQQYKARFGQGGPCLLSPSG